MIKRFVFRLAAALLALLLAAAAVEAIANVYLFARDRRYIAPRARLAELGNAFVTSVTKNDPGCRYIDTLYPHPYLAFVHHGNPPCGLTVNNIGLSTAWRVS